MSVTIQDLGNADAAVEMHERREAQKAAQREEFHELEATRQQLEEPQPAGDAEAAEATAEDVSDGFEMTDQRRVGTLTLQTEDGGPVRFGKPSGRTSTEMLEPLEEMERAQASIADLQRYVWGTLAEWSLDDEHDADYWADNHALVDAITLVRNLSLGGNGPIR